MAQIKTKEQIKKVVQACKITDQIFAKIIKNFYFKTENELKSFILQEIKNRGLKPSFDPIVTSGGRAGNEIHPQATDSKLKGFVIIDMGVVYEKYMSDMTRTIFIGTPTLRDMQIYNKLLISQVSAIVNVKDGVNAGMIDAYTRKLLGKDAKYFIHMLGHGVGTKIHEEPKLYYKLTKPVLKTGMIITIEPGLYVKNRYGIRIEDTLEVTKKGFKILTKSPKELIWIK
jgi:Xaa-Pro aminopeptidase